MDFSLKNIWGDEIKYKRITTIQMKKILFDAGRKDGSLRIEAKDAIAYPHAHWL